ncbi:hypothetical protein [Tabrizicola fusiformis]|uniref:hypothetical protein n=1 Tax=Tabrizicola sp. SY72 TaxID=2741673 RepID=UPI0015736982|nr:hypothetical protein [Tabrizicola sp. SY72]NTT88519.1 hypothetical protein [Tabrizicola sp. SY72]
MASFMIWGEPDSKLRLASYSATTKGEKARITIVVETVDFRQLGYALAELAEVRAAQVARLAPPAKTNPKQKPLALPPPPLRLMKSEE